MRAGPPSGGPARLQEAKSPVDRRSIGDDRNGACQAWKDLIERAYYLLVETSVTDPSSAGRLGVTNQ
jgi:hypothetical protein